MIIAVIAIITITTIIIKLIYHRSWNYSKLKIKSRRFHH